MAAPVLNTAFRWLPNGDEAFAAMLAAIAAARHSVRLETYIFAAGIPGNQFLEALLLAQQRGVRTHVLVDAWGSQDLADSYWEPLRQAGGEFRWFNERTHRGFMFRDHRKLLVCDEQIAFVGGFNLAPEYAGDGVARGWCDVGLHIAGPLAAQLADSFDKMFTRAELRHGAFMRVMRTGAHARIASPDGDLLMSGPGRGFSTLKRALQKDLKHARSVQIMAAYFLPTWKLRRALTRVARRGGQVQIILPGQSDVPLSQLASRRLYRVLLAAGVEVYEYQPQILHAKLVLIDDLAYVGSANLDTRSLHINYELTLRLRNERVAEGGRRVFAANLAHCKRITRADWQASQTFWTRLKQRWAYFILARLDLYLARRQLAGLR
ncbi:MAG: phosphatidylserine/phosphatidylglycerophosphate/cardiolipin synthase family protein [Proteobacteria bacterium]|nr:phosphatidylserine/phosphatidylglycerophosphate/cardiolipin synthase family protein [Verrucomicrobiota bacterium]NBU08021.1 phosphatidylserine/phosphatidylglycerophosphate/cardiolipin synthase family protein [Pseudomonadota bacterium]